MILDVDDFELWIFTEAFNLRFFWGFSNKQEMVCLPIFETPVAKKDSVLCHPSSSSVVIVVTGAMRLAALFASLSALSKYLGSAFKHLIQDDK